MDVYPPLEPIDDQDDWSDPWFDLAREMSCYTADAQAWFDLGRSFFSWFHAHEDELHRLIREVSEAKALLPEAILPSDLVTIDWLGPYRPPSLASIAAAAKPLTTKVPPGLFTVRHDLSLLAAAAEDERNAVVQRLTGAPVEILPLGEWLCRGVAMIDGAIGLELNHLSRGTWPSPVWDRHRGELRFDHQLLKKIIVGKAVKVVAVLDAFQNAGWPPRVDLPEEFRARNVSRITSDQLHQTLKSLNQNLWGVDFRSDGQGDGIVWSFK